MRSLRFLLDADISPETAVFLRSLGFDAESLIEKGLGGLSDAEVAKRAIEGGKILVTFDLDFGELHYFSSPKKFSVIVLRLDDQRVENVNSVLKEFLRQHNRKISSKRKRLVVIGSNEVRIAQ